MRRWRRVNEAYDLSNHYHAFRGLEDRRARVLRLPDDLISARRIIPAPCRADGGDAGGGR